MRMKQWKRKYARGTENKVWAKKKFDLNNIVIHRNYEELVKKNLSWTEEILSKEKLELSIIGVEWWILYLTSVAASLNS